VYACKKKLPVAGCQLPVNACPELVEGAWSEDLAAAAPLPAWMIELAEQVGMIEPGERAGLPTG
jgi:hypothetical protein